MIHLKSDLRYFELITTWHPTFGLFTTWRPTSGYELSNKKNPWLHFFFSLSNRKFTFHFFFFLQLTAPTFFLTLSFSANYTFNFKTFTWKILWKFSSFSPITLTSKSTSEHELSKNFHPKTLWFFFSRNFSFNFLFFSEHPKFYTYIFFLFPLLHTLKIFFSSDT